MRRTSDHGGVRERGVIRIGPAGWSYPDWEGRVYPSPKPRGFDALGFLSGFFSTVEVNSTFYAQPNPGVVSGWVRTVREHSGFRFTFKLHQSFTHGPPEEELEDGPAHWEAAAGSYRAGLAAATRSKLVGAVLVQFPQSFHFSDASVRRIGRIRTLFPDWNLVLEVRHASWFEPPALDIVRGRGYSLALVDLPFAWDHPPRWHSPTGPVGYLRLHGRNSRTWFARGAGRDERYDYLYRPDELRELVQRARRLAAEHDETYVVTNNHFSGKAVSNAVELQHLVGGERVPAAAEWLRAFPHLEPITSVRGQQELW